MKILISLIIVLSLPVLAAEKTKEFDIKELRRMTIKNSVGDVAISASGDSKVYIVYKITAEEDCSIGNKSNLFELDLITKSKKSGFFSRSQCRVNMDLKIPRHVKVDVATSTGDIKIEGLKKLARVRSGSGSVVVGSSVTDLDVFTGSGNVRVSEGAKNATIHSGSGSIEFDLKAVPQRGSLRLSVGSGDIDLKVPKSAKIKTDISTGSGQLTNDIKEDLESDYFLKVRAGSGDVHIKKTEI